MSKKAEGEMQLALEAFGREVRRRRKALGLSQGELKKSLAFSTIVAVEAGKNNLTISNLARICGALDIDIAKYFKAVEKAKLQEAISRKASGLDDDIKEAEARLRALQERKAAAARVGSQP